jgi:HlyD family secretion protein
MNQQEQSDNQLQEESIGQITQDYDRENPNNEIVYIAELNGEFFTVDYNNQKKDRNDPTVTPLKIVEFMNPSESQAISASEYGQLASVDSEQKTELQPPKSSFAPTTFQPNTFQPTTFQPTELKLPANKSLFFGIGLGLLIAWGAAKLYTSNSTPKSVVADVPAQTASPQVHSVTIAPVKTTNVDRVIEVSGTVEALELIPVTSEVPGLQIEAIFVDEGSKVTKGQVLAKLKDDTIQAELNQAKAAVDGAKARLAELQAGSRDEEIARAKERVNSAIAGVEQAQSDLELVSKRVDRNRNLQAEGAISRDRLDEINNQERISRATLDRAEATLQEANQELKQLKTGARPEVISQAKAELAQAQGQLQYASVQLENTVIKAVTDGVIAERNAKVGDLTSAKIGNMPSPAQNLFTIIQNNSLELKLKVPETDLNKIRPGQSANIINNQNSNEPIVGKIREIDPIVDSNSRQAFVKVNLPSKTNLQPGMFLEAAITTSQEQGTTVPIKALLPQTEDNAIAFVLQNNNTVEARPVKMGEILTNNQIEVLNGLENGEYVVVKGAAYLKNGDRVSIEPEN